MYVYYTYRESRTLKINIVLAHGEIKAAINNGLTSLVLAYQCCTNFN